MHSIIPSQIYVDCKSVHFDCAVSCNPVQCDLDYLNGKSHYFGYSTGTVQVGLTQLKWVKPSTCGLNLGQVG